jgi:hypothetical protein
LKSVKYVVGEFEVLLRFHDIDVGLRSHGLGIVACMQASKQAELVGEKPVQTSSTPTLRFVDSVVFQVHM